MLLVASEHFHDVRYQECVEERQSEVREDGSLVEVVDPECPISFVNGVRTYNFELGWLWALIYLGPWLALYGIVELVRKRVRGAKHA
jgi:hypothetical protein